MSKFYLILLVLNFSCNRNNIDFQQTENSPSKVISTAEFKLLKIEDDKGLLILFPCYPCDAENTLKESNIAKISVENGFSVLAMNFNQLLYLKTDEKLKLKEQLERIIDENNLSKCNIYIGGFSSGGNVSLLISDYLVKIDSYIKPKGVFIVDSPIDLLGLYKTSDKNIKLNYSKSSVQQSKWIKNLLENELGNPVNGIDNYEFYSPFTLGTKNIKNLKGLMNLKIRFYTEPDLEWWDEYSKNNYSDLNAFYIEKLFEQLKAEDKYTGIELIRTENKGYRASGVRHPHSWSIVNENNLIQWMLE